ncbi:MAG: type IV toxin-antitoxin system AbiEi family antitoxin [Deltaproteobacteria bacterium]|nr:type IV toxin-antitoxin system AbiEi family antitoxin [Deltaproteobacteria bacterium]
MTSAFGSKINQLLKEWPSGVVVVSRWLKEQGISQQLADKYEKTSWLSRIGPGAFIRAGEKVAWDGGLYALQAQLQLPVHVAAKSALELLGFAHFIPLGKSPIRLFGNPGTKLPRWFNSYAWENKIQYFTPGLFFNMELGLTQKDMGNFSVQLSSPERAILEVLYLVPKQQSFEEAHLLMEGLVTLRPKLVQQLLENCKSIKVKRLFMLIAEKLNHTWLKKLSLEKVDFGKGKRSLIKEGVFNKKYQITVPKNYYAKSESLA